ncbi:hypothetical protein ACYOEI_01060 [Singulisphaera rosea]
MSEEIRNAVIERAVINDAERGMLTAWLQLNYGGTGQGFGGYALYLPKTYSHHKVESPAGHFIWRCMEIAGVTSWDAIAGKTIRVKLDKPGFGGSILGIGHIVKDDWFYPKLDLAGDDHARTGKP